MLFGKRGEERMRMTTKRFLPFLLALLALSLVPLGSAQTPAVPAVAPAAAPAPAPKPITDADVAGAPVPTADARAKGDPDGSLTGTASDVTVRSEEHTSELQSQSNLV